MPAEPAPGQADPGYAAYEAYAMAAPDDLEFSEWEDLPEWQQKAIYAAADAAYEARAAAVAAPLNAELARLREEAASLRGQLAQAQADYGELEGEKGLLARLGMAQEAISDLAAERDRYRAALEKITVDGGSLGDIARKALAVQGRRP